MHVLRCWTDEDMDADPVTAPLLTPSDQDAVRQSAERGPVAAALCGLTP